MKLKKMINAGILTGLFAVIVCACGGAGSLSGNSSAAPDVPSGVTATQGTLEEGVLINWDDAGDAEYYIVYKALDTPESFKVVATRVMTNSYTDTPVSSGRIFYYRVAAGNGNSWSEPGTEVMGFALKGTPMPPASVTIPVNQIGQVTLEWDAVINADSYNVYRCDVKYGTYAKLNSEAITSATYTDTTALADKKYYYKIVPVNEYGEGAESVIISGSALQQIPVWSGTVVLTATDETFGEKVMITWTAADYAATYTVLRAPEVEGAAGEYAVIAENVTGLAFDDRDTDISDKTPYYYRVVAVSSGGQTDSGLSDAGSVDRSKPAQVNPPATVRASKGSINVITVTWSEVPEANGGYSVYRSSSSSFTLPIKVADKFTAAAVEGKISFDDTTMAPVADRETYYYKVTAWSVAGVNEVESGMNASSAEGFTNPDLPGVPVNIVGSMNYTDGSITVSWSAADSWTRQYTVYRSDDGGENYNLICQNQTGTSITETLVADGGTVEAGIEYLYQIKAINSLGQESALSSDTSAMFTLRVPTNFQVTSKYNYDWYCTYTYTVTWTAVKGATGYEVGYYYSDEWHLIGIANPATTTVTFKSPNYGGGSYPVRIRSINTTPDIEGDEDIYSDYSAEVRP
ncbi:MAG: hypothetical protein GXY14_00735 [Spirochaetes bacterium]|nr:hypothetical protein [Spirochaetota bacterium]